MRLIDFIRFVFLPIPTVAMVAGIAVAIILGGILLHFNLGKMLSYYLSLAFIGTVLIDVFYHYYDE